LSRDWRPNAVVFVGDAGRRFWTCKAGDRVAIMIDFDLILRLVVLVYVIGMNKEEDVVADFLSGFLLLSIVVPRDEEFPGLFPLMMALAGCNARIVNDLFGIVGDFVIFHEIGHTYVCGFGSEFVRVAFQFPAGFDPTPERVKSIRFHSDGPIFNVIDVPESQNGLLIMAPNFAHWNEEFAPDVFSVYASVFTRAGHGKPTALNLEQFVDGLGCWQHVLFAMGRREKYIHGIMGEADITRLSHPDAHTRMDVVVHHINYLAEEFAPAWVSPALARFKTQYDSLWSADLQKLISDGINYVRYAFDEEGPHINEGRILTFTGGPVQYSPSALTKLKTRFLDTFLAQAERIGWDNAVDEGKAKYTKWFETFKVNDRFIVLELGKRLREIKLRLISKDDP
jgi:hypothetical protein